MMRKLENYGCSKQVVGLVIPTGYSFNLDGTSIYLSMVAIFIAQAYGVDLDVWHQITLLAILMLTSKGRWCNRLWLYYTCDNIKDSR